MQHLKVLAHRFSDYATGAGGLVVGYFMVDVFVLVWGPRSERLHSARRAGQNPLLGDLCRNAP